MKPKNQLTIFLMISSMALLIILQVFWLSNSYEKAYFDLRARTDGLFRSTVTAVMDSMLIRKIEMVPNDNTEHKGKIFFTQHVDTTLTLPDDKASSTHIRKGSSQIQIYVSSNTRSDSVKAMLRPIASRFRKGTLTGSTFYLRMDGDSLNLDSLKNQFNLNLLKSNLALSFEIKVKKMPLPFSLPTPAAGFKRIGVDIHTTQKSFGEEEPQLSAFGNVIKSEWIGVPPYSYAAHINNIRPLLLKEIAPQIFFSGVLTLLTLMSFIFMYRSICSQQHLMILKNDFISNITHELKTPIATVSVALEALKNFNGIDNPRLIGEYLDIAQHELGRLSVLTDKVLTTSLFDEHGIKIDFEKIDLGNIVDDVVNSLKLVFEKQKATVVFEKEGNNFILNGSDVHLTNVVHNLLDNALKYSPSDPDITITLREEKTNILLTVKDKGPGIPIEFHKKIFEKFFRMPTGNVHNIKGYGLGLSYVDSVVKSHHGSISVTSQPGAGSKFMITLPRANG